MHDLVSSQKTHEKSMILSPPVSLLGTVHQGQEGSKYLLPCQVVPQMRDKMASCWHP
jgi:hypothetical protein